MHVITLFLIMLTVSSFSSFLYKLLIAIIFIISSFYLPVALSFGPVDFNTLLSVKYSNVREGIMLIKTIPGFYFSLPLVTLAMTIFIFDIKVDKLNFRPIIITYLFISLVSTPVRLYINEGRVKVFSTGIPVVRFVTDVLENYRQVDEETALMQQSLTTPDVWAPERTLTNYQNYIIIIGESVRSDYLNAYGFPIGNTPFMSSAPGVLFTHYISAASSTQTSLKNSLSLRRGLYVELNNNIITLANKAGFTTFWYSNQGSLGPHDTSVASFAKRANLFNFMQKGKSSDGVGSGDFDLLGGVASVMKKNKPAKMIVLHLMGSHPLACDRTKGKYQEFSQSKEISCYIQSIRETDELLSRVVELAKESGQSWSMMYFADHGLAFKGPDTDNARLQHGDKLKQNYTVPMFMTSSDSKRREVNSYPRSAINFLSLFAQWTGIKDKLIGTGCNMLADVPCDNQDRVIQFTQEQVLFSSLGEDTPAH